MRWSFSFFAVLLLERPDEEPGFGLAGHLISLLLQASAVSPVFWQRSTESHSSSARANTKASQREKANDSRENGENTDLGKLTNTEKTQLQRLLGSKVRSDLFFHQ